MEWYRWEDRGESTLCGHGVSHAASSFELGDYSLQQPTIG